MPRQRNTWLFSFSIAAILAMGGGYWYFCQEQLISPLVQKIESISVDQTQQISPKDHLALERDRITLQNNLNSTVFQLVSGLFFVITASIAWLNLKATEEKQLSERFSKAIEQLSSKELEVRIGSVYSLERLAKDSLNDHWTVMEVLTAFIRNKSLKGESVSPSQISEQENQSLVDFSNDSVRRRSIANRQAKVTADIQAALTVISRRDDAQDPKDKFLDLSFCDLRGSNLREAKLSRADLRGVKLEEANLERANLADAKLENSDLTGAILKFAQLKRAELHLAKMNYADLRNAELQGANLNGSELQGAILRDSKLNNSDLSFASFVKAELQGADFTKAVIRHTNLKDSHIDDSTKLKQKWRRVHQINKCGGKGQNFDSVDFSEAVLANANFEGASLKKANFDGANLSGANFKLANLEKATFQKTDIGTRLESACFNGASLREAVFSQADLSWAQFEEFNQQKTDISGAVFTSVNLENATFENSFLKGTTFTGELLILLNTNFQRAKLEESKIEFASAQGARFERANLTGAIFIRSNLKGAVFSSSNYQEAQFIDIDSSEIIF